MTFQVRRHHRPPPFYQQVSIGADQRFFLFSKWFAPLKPAELCGWQSGITALATATLLLFLSVVPASDAFNIEERNPIVKKALPHERGSYFGFSVAQHRSTAATDTPTLAHNWILVGAPLGTNLQPNTNRSGALYKCPITQNPHDCVQVETDGKRFNDFEYNDDVEDEWTQGGPSQLEPPGKDEIKEGQWLGVTVRSQKPGGKVVVCAHRYIQSPDLRLHHYGLGLCYLLSTQLETEGDLQPCKGRPMDKLHQQYGFCQVGTSLSVLDNGIALMGSPGPYTWRGTIFANEVVGKFLEKDTTMYRGPLNDDSRPLQKYSYLGMSVAGGRFFHRHRITYASGAPRSQLFGQVFFFEKHLHVEELNISFVLTGEQFASSFGYEILAIDINRDGYDDLLVAAPFYYNERHGGAVYMYYNLAKCQVDWHAAGVPCKWDAVIRGRPESRFGFAMTSLWDINKDGYSDVAIGAPYENDGEGAVYIYLGSQHGLQKEHSQVIRKRHLQTLGYSLSGGLDMDNNGYPDLLVGAYESDLAILYRTRPIIDISIEIDGAELKNINATRKGCAADASNTENTCFTFRSCFMITSQLRRELLGSRTEFRVHYQVKELLNKKMSRVWFRNFHHPDKHESTIRRSVHVKNPRDPYCQVETVYIKEGIGDIITPIKFLVNYTLENNVVDSPILNKTSIKEFEATFQKSCGSDDICESNLVLNAGTLLEKTDDGYIVNLGENEEFLLDANVTNVGESAYEAKLFVVHPPTLSYIALQMDKDKPPSAQQSQQSNVICSYENDTMVACNLGNPFAEGRSIYLRMRFEINKSTREQKLALRVFVNSTSRELSNRTSYDFIAILKKIAEYSIEGKAITPHLFFGGEVKGESAMKHLEDIGARVSHLYQVTNHGQWQIQDMDVLILWPYQLATSPLDGSSASSNRPGKWLLYLESTPQIDGGTGNYCYVDPPAAVNPLKLNVSQETDDNDDDDEEHEDNNDDMDRDGADLQKFSTDFHHISNSETEANETQRIRRRLRRKRDVEYVLDAETIQGPDGKLRKVVTMDCARGSARCVSIVCKVAKLNKADQVRIRVVSRIWNSTLVEDYMNVDWVRIRSIGQVHIADPTIIHGNDSVALNIVETIAYPGLVLADTSLNIWIIIGSVVAGLLLLILLILILYKVGFFKRNRIKDHTLSALVKKQGESESLLKVNESRT